jgi:hypothetical protein
LMSTPRRGIMLLEAAVAFGLLAVLIAICLQMLAATAAARRAVDRRAIAAQEGANLIERLTAMPWDKITPEGLVEVPLSSSIQELLPGAAAKITVAPSSDPGPQSKHLALEITWTGPTGETESPVRLDYWTYAVGKESQP